MSEFLDIGKKIEQGREIVNNAAQLITSKAEQLRDHVGYAINSLRGVTLNRVINKSMDFIVDPYKYTMEMVQASTDPGFRIAARVLQAMIIFGPILESYIGVVSGVGLLVGNALVVKGFRYLEQHPNRLSHSGN